MKDDLINRQAAINAIENTECELLAEEWDELTDAIKQVPSAQQWILVSERFPEEGNPYIIYHESFGIRIDTRINGEWKTYGEDTVLAWMPLPEPYEGGE